MKIYLDKSTNAGNGNWLTNSGDSVVLALGEDHHSLPLPVGLGEVLGLLGDLCNVIRLRKKQQQGECVKSGRMHRV